MSKIQEAIDWLKDLQKKHAVTANWWGACDSGILALQDHAKREKGCEYCKHGCDLENGNDCEPSLYISGNKLIALRYDEPDSKAEINFCPMCGRDLRKPVDHAT